MPTNDQFKFTRDEDFQDLDLSSVKGHGLKIKGSNSGIFDIKGSYSWTVNSASNREEVPFVHLKEFQINVSALQRSLNYWINAFDKTFTQNGSINFNNNAANPYEALYTAIPTGNVYELPWFTSYDHVIQNSWGGNKGISAWADNAMSGLANVQRLLSPAAGIESPYAWQGSQNSTYAVQFDLLNTVSPADIQRNYNFRQTLINNNLPQRLNATLSLPPVFYELWVPGVRYAPVVAIQNLQVENIGELNRLDDVRSEYNGLQSDSAEGIIVPDAYRFTIDFIELIKETRVLFEQSTKHDKIKAISVPSVDAFGRTRIQADFKNSRAVRGILGNDLSSFSQEAIDETLAFGDSDFGG
jgi:hypothetical protein